MSERPLFILGGNGSYLNRGCEAIVRGTVKILKQYYDKPHFICISHFSSREEFEFQRDNEIDDSIHHLASYRPSKNDALSSFYMPKTWKCVYRNFLNKKKIGYSIYGDVFPYLHEAKAVLSIGGDNYSLDYGRPDLFTALDDFILMENKPLILWGASVGPFDKLPDYEAYMSRHLQKVTGIFARESETIDYLRGIGVCENVHPVSDPAFVMDAVKPEGIDNEFHIKEEAIGLNLSPLMANYVTGGDLNKWTQIAASIIKTIAKKTELPIYLIPHVTITSSNDHSFMNEALSLIKDYKNNIKLISPKYNAAETKWIIGQMTVFAGARTHSTIASMSSLVPTLSFAYSMKARGINQDLFDHIKYCHEPTDLDAEVIARQIEVMLVEREYISKELRNRIPFIKDKAMKAGNLLKSLTN